MKQELDTTENGQKKLKWSEKIAYGFGDFGNGFMFDLGQAYLTKFYTDIALIPAGMVGVIFSITKIFDAFMDPLAGSFVLIDYSGNFDHYYIYNAEFFHDGKNCLCICYIYDMGSCL